MNIIQQKAALEAMIFAHGQAVSELQLSQALCMELQQVQVLLQELKKEYEQESHGILLIQLENRWQFCTKKDYTNEVCNILQKRKQAPLSQAAMEVLAIVAYNQPVSKAFVEQIRGVDSSGAMQTLVQKGLIEEAGRMDLPGRPLSFQTTDLFLHCFGINQLSQLPPIPQRDYEQQKKEGTS